MFSTAYLNILLSSVTAPEFMRVVLQFLITGCHDNEPLLDALVGRVECVSDVGNPMVTMTTSLRCLLLLVAVFSIIGAVIPLGGSEL